MPGIRRRCPFPRATRLLSPVLRGSVVVNGSRRMGGAELLVLDRAGDEVNIDADADSTLLLLSGVPISEPIVGYGPFVMNSREEIETAMRDFQSGKFGRMPPLKRLAAARGPALSRSGIPSL